MIIHEFLCHVTCVWGGGGGGEGVQSKIAYIENK